MSVIVLLRLHSKLIQTSFKFSLQLKLIQTTVHPSKHFLRAESLKQNWSFSKRNLKLFLERRTCFGEPTTSRRIKNKGKIPIFFWSKREYPSRLNSLGVTLTLVRISLLFAPLFCITLPFLAPFEDLEGFEVLQNAKKFHSKTYLAKYFKNIFFQYSKKFYKSSFKKHEFLSFFPVLSHHL